MVSSDKLRVSVRDPKPVEIKVVIETKIYIYKYATKSHFMTQRHSKMSYAILFNKTNKQTCTKGT